MASKMEIRNHVKETVAARFVEAFPEAVQIDDFSYALPMGTAEDNGAPLFAKFDLSCPNWYATVKTEAFDLDTKVAAYNAELAERAAKAEAKAKAAAEKEAKRQAKEAK